MQQRIAWFATVRPRVGYASGPVLFYVTGGLAVANIRTSYSTTEIAQFSGRASDTRAGGAVGAGIEAALIGNWTAKIEYLYLDFGNVSDTFIYQTVGFFGPGTARSDVSGHVVDHVARAGVNYRFGDPAAPGLWWDAAPAAAPDYQGTGHRAGAVQLDRVLRWRQHRLRRWQRPGAGKYLWPCSAPPTNASRWCRAACSAAARPATTINRSSRFVVGVEGDIQGANQRDTACFSWCPPVPLATPTTYSQSMNWFVYLPCAALASPPDLRCST